MPRRSRIRLSYPCDTPSPSLLQTSSTSLLIAGGSPTKPTDHISQTYYTTTLSAVPPAALLSPPFREDGLVAATTTPLTRTNTLSANRGSLLLSVDNPTFASLGLPTTHALLGYGRRAVTERLLSSFTPVVPSRSGKALQRAQRVLNEDRVGTVEVAVSNGTAHALPEHFLRRFNGQEREISPITRVSRCAKYDTSCVELLREADNDGVEETLLALLRLFTGRSTSGDICITTHQYEGFCNMSLTKDALVAMMEWSRKNGVMFCAVLARGAASSPVLWEGKGARVNSACEPGYGGDTAELFVFVKGACSVFKMLGSGDE